MFNKKEIKNLVIRLFEDQYPFDEGRRMSDKEIWERSKEKVIDSLEKRDQDYELIGINPEDEEEKFEEARIKAIKFINDEL